MINGSDVSGGLARNAFLRCHDYRLRYFWSFLKCWGEYSPPCHSEYRNEINDYSSLRVSFIIIYPIVRASGAEIFKGYESHWPVARTLVYLYLLLRF